MSDPGLTSEQRAAIAVHNATQNRMCLNLSGNGQICVACSEVADQIDAAVLVAERAAEERGRLAAAVVCKCGDELQPNDGAICGACLQPEIVEAEERGRRRGVVQGLEIRDLLVETIYWLKARTLPSRALNADLISRVDAAVERFDIAPRDSGKGNT